MSQPEQFDFAERDRQLHLGFYERKARIEAFDKLVDLALDGVISLDDAKVAWESEVLSAGEAS